MSSGSSPSGDVEEIAGDQVAEESTEVSSPICPYCTAPVLSEETACPSCSTTYHYDCAVEAGGCIEPSCTAAVGNPGTAVAGATALSSVSDSSQVAEAGTGSGLTSAVPAKSGFRGSRAAKVLAAICLVLIGMVCGALATESNVFSSILGKNYSSEDVDQARAEGNKSGYDSGYSSGRSSGYSSGLSEGKSAGCRQVFSYLGTTRVVDYFDWLINTMTASSYSSTSC